jgi:hypothetical protein
MSYCLPSEGVPVGGGWIVIKILKQTLICNDIKLNPPPALRATSSKGGQKYSIPSYQTKV